MLLELCSLNSNLSIVYNLAFIGLNNILCLQMLNVKGVCTRRFFSGNKIANRPSKQNNIGISNYQKNIARRMMKTFTDFCARVTCRFHKTLFRGFFSLCETFFTYFWAISNYTYSTSCVVRILFLLCGTNWKKYIIKDKKEILLTKYTLLKKSSGVSFAFTAINAV